MKLTKSDLTRLAKQPGRHRILRMRLAFSFKVIGDADRVYWTYRHRVAGRENEPSLGPYPETGLAEAIAKHRSWFLPQLPGQRVQLGGFSPRA